MIILIENNGNKLSKKESSNRSVLIQEVTEYSSREILDTVLKFYNTNYKHLSKFRDDIVRPLKKAYDPAQAKVAGAIATVIKAYDHLLEVTKELSV